MKKQVSLIVIVFTSIFSSCGAVDQKTPVQDTLANTDTAQVPVFGDTTGYATKVVDSVSPVAPQK